MANSGHDSGYFAKYIVFPIIIALALAFIGYAILQEAPLHIPFIIVSASGSVSAVPDQAQLSLSLNAVGATAADAIANLSVATGAMKAALLPFLNGNSSAIHTQSYSVYVPPRCVNSTSYYYPDQNCLPKGAPIYYVATESVSATLPDVNSTDQALVALSKVPGLNISGVSAKLSPQQQANMSQQALALALENATGQARTLANGAKIKVQNITVQSGYIFYPEALGASFAKGAALNQTFFAGRATVTKSIYVVFSVR